jgi:hypothetical protein
LALLRQRVEHNSTKQGIGIAFDRLFLKRLTATVMVLPCVAALPKDEKLDAEDQDILDKLEIDRMNVLAFKQLERQDPKRSSLDTGNGKEMMDAMRMGFGQNVGQLCQSIPALYWRWFSPV